MNNQELERLANICYYDFDNEDDCEGCHRYEKCREILKEKI